MPKLSVVIPLWNKEPYVKNTLESVRDQTYTDFEILVINDGSTDGSADIVQAFADPRLRLIVQQHQGISAARNRGISEAGGDLIAFLDADDEWLPTFLETIVRLYKDCPQAGIFSTAYKFKKPGGYFEKAKYTHLPDPPWEGILPNYFRSAQSRSPVTLTSATVFKKSVFGAAGSFMAGTWLEDCEISARIAFLYPVAWSSRVEVIYRRDVTTSALRIVQLLDDPAVIDTLKKGLPLCTDGTRKDVLNLIGKYYKLSSIEYARCGDKKNAVRCITESLRYLRGYRLIKPFLLRAIFPQPFRVFETLDGIRSAFNRYYYRSR